MYVLEGGLVKAELKTQGELDAIVGQLSRHGYKPALRSAVTELLRTAGIDTAEPQASEVSSLIVSLFADELRYSLMRARGPLPIVGELFFADESAIVLQPEGAHIAVCEIRPHTSSGINQGFVEHLAEAVKATLDGRRLRGMNFDIKDFPSDYFSRNPRTFFPVPSENSELTLKMRSAEMTPDDIVNAELLSDVNLRGFLQRLVQVGKARSKDAKQDFDPSVVEPLVARDLVRREYLVLCRKDSSTLCSVESREEIESSVGSKIRCSNCGRTFAEELLQEIYAPAPSAKALIDGSHWMTIWVTNVLVGAGVELDKISWGATAGEDEIDLVVELQGVRVFFELKDREFGLGDAYPFSSRMQRYGANRGFIVSTEIVAEEVKRFLGEQRGPQISTIEGKAEVSRKLCDEIVSISSSAVSQRANVVFSRIEVDLQPILQVWMEKSSR